MCTTMYNYEILYTHTHALNIYIQTCVSVCVFECECECVCVRACSFVVVHVACFVLFSVQVKYL